MNNEPIKQLLKNAWRHKHMVYTYPLLKIAMISPFIGINAVLHRLRGVTVGKEVKIAHDVLIDATEPQSITLGDYVTISPRVKIFAHALTSKEGITSANPTKIKKNTWICTGATISPGVTVGEYCVVGAGAVVTTDIPDFTLALGVPAKPVRTLKKIYTVPENATVTRELVLTD